MQPIKIRIRDYEYLVKTEENEERIDSIAKHINEKLKEIQDNTEGLSEKKMAILVALHIASDYFQLLKERDEMLANIRQRTEALIYNIDSMMS